MKVVVAGYPKTGTKSIAAALRVLGYQVYDFIENFQYLEEEWMKIMNEDGTLEDFKRMFKDVDAVCDVPASYFWQEIVRAFPDSKVILTVRDNEEEWIKSLENQFETLSRNFALRMLFTFTPYGYRFKKYHRSIRRIVFGIPEISYFQHTCRINRLLAFKNYRMHNEYVKNILDNQKLLVFKINEGWEPLCSFLGQPVPDVKFPHKNVRGSLTEEFNRHQVARKMKQQFILLLSIIFIISALLLHYFCSY